MSSSNATTYNKILSKGIEANLPVNIGLNKLRFTTDTGRLFLDNEGTDRIEITDFVKGKTKEEILGTLAPLPKFYLSSDTQELYYYDTTGTGEWKSLRVPTAQYAVESGHSVNADTASYANNASSSSYSSKGIENITRNGLNFTVFRSNGSTFTFNQQDNNTTYSLATTTSAGLMPSLNNDTTKYLRADGTWSTPIAEGPGIDINGATISNAGVRAVTLNGNNLNINTNGSTQDITIPYATNAGTSSYASAADKATKDGVGNTITSTYAPLASPVFTGTPVVPDVASGDKSSKIANTKFVNDAISASTYSAMSVAEGIAGTSTVSKVMTAANLKGMLQGSTYIYSYAPCVEADFDFGELTSTGEIFNQ